MKPQHSGRDWRKIHHSPIFWIGVLMCLVAIAVYVLSDALSWRPGTRKTLLRPFGRRKLAVVLDGIALDILQVEGGIQDAAIAAETLGFVERGVGFPHQGGLVDGRAFFGGAPPPD